jgi:SPP1 gp7 family putative phage head morphogenesis protein
MLLLYQGTDIILSESVIEATAAYLLQALAANGNIDLAKVDWFSPDNRMLRIMRDNTYKLAGYKTFHQIRDYRSLIYDPVKKGIRPFAEYKELFRKIDDQYNKRWIRAEYEHAYQSARQGAKFQEFEKTKDRYWLKYDAVGDGNMTDLCRKLDGMALPVDDPFWDDYTPPNHWGCRSNIRRVRKDESKLSQVPKEMPDQDEVFQNNPGKTGIIFPDKHPYFKVGGKSKGVINKWVQSAIKWKYKE